jgi:CheY-like chemotaxis protein
VKKRGTVLFVEDETDLRQAVALLLERHGYTVATAANGKEALSTLDEIGPPCLIVLNLSMPEMDGFELRKRLLQRSDLADVPVVLVSATADIKNAAQTLNAVAYLQKPIDFSKLYALVDTYCS